MRAPKLGLATIVGLSHSLEQVLDVAQAVGVDGVEITGRGPHLAPNSTVAHLEEVKLAAAVRGLEILAFGSYLGCRGRFAPADVEFAVTTARVLDTARLRVWAESPTSAFDGAGFTKVVELLQACCDASASGGIEVVVERHRHSFADSVEDVEHLLEAVNRPNVALNYQPLDHLPATAASEVPEDARQLGARSTYSHLKNYRPSGAAPPTLELGASLEDGVLDYEQILENAFLGGYSGPLVLEFTEDDDSKSLHERVRADVDFLRQLLAKRGAR